MTKIILDASALLALLNSEPGHLEVAKVLGQARMSTVNVSEVITVLRSIKISQSEAENMVTDLVHDIIDFDKEQAFLAASLREKTKTLGLSFGDRACIALGIRSNSEIITADRIWKKLDWEGAIIRTIR